MHTRVKLKEDSHKDYPSLFGAPERVSEAKTVIIKAKPCISSIPKGIVYHQHGVLHIIKSQRNTS